MTPFNPKAKCPKCGRRKRCCTCQDGSRYELGLPYVRTPAEHNDVRGINIIDLLARRRRAQIRIRDVWDQLSPAQQSRVVAHVGDIARRRKPVAINGDQ